MGKKNNDIEKLFREGLDDLRIRPSGRVWTRISRQLFLEKFRVFSPRTFNVYYALALAAIIAALAIISLTDTRERRPAEQQNMPQPAIPVIPHSDTAATGTLSSPGDTVPQLQEKPATGQDDTIRSQAKTGNPAAQIPVNPAPAKETVPADKKPGGIGLSRK